MVDFQLPEDLVKEIQEYFDSCDDKEPCGIIGVKKGKLYFKPISNVSTEPYDKFLLDSTEYVKAQLSYDILYIIHGHLKNCTPSDYDVSCCMAVGMPYIVINRETYEYSIVRPNNYKNLVGRQYVFGKYDCFSACKDWYEFHGIFANKRDLTWEDRWWEKDLNYIDEQISQWPFKETTGLEYGDLITFKVNSAVPNHLGVYVGRDKFFHHAVDRLSCTEDLYSILWGSSIDKVYRYEKGNITRRAWR